MCGILGARSLSGPLTPRLARAALDTLRHRGPDGEGWWEDPRTQLGFRRLAIIDVAGGQQPLVNEDGRVLLTLNGEIYNHHALRAELASEHRFATGSDAEVVLHGYEAWGEAVFSRLRGMFAAAIVDLRQDRVVLARDRVGKKPLYFTVRGGAVYWASELRPLMSLGRPPIDRAALNDYLRFGYVPAPRTLLSGVFKLPAGSLLRLEGGRIVADRWAPRFGVGSPAGRPDADPEAWAEQVREALGDAVAARLESEVPLGFLLSGGVDSAAVFALGAEALERTATAFTIGFDDAELDEREAAAEVARRYAADHRVRVLREDEADDLGAVVARCEEPLATDALLPTDRVFAAVRAEGITTVLAGEGSDEIFAGYTKFLAAINLDAASWARAGDGPLARYLSSEEFCFPGLAQRRALLGEAATDAGYAELEDEVAHLDPLSQMLAFEVALRLPDRINHRLDRLSMAHAIEARAPFMDPAVIALALSVPHTLRHRQGQGKWILRSAMQRHLPPRVTQARKAPFRAPDTWFVSALTEARVREAGLVRPEAFKALAQSARHDAVAREGLYNLAVLHLWHERWYRSLA